MKILCVCKQGIVRSGALAWLFKTEFEQDAVSIGYDGNGDELKSLLYDWADSIIALDNTALQLIPISWHFKTLLFDVGEDRWHDPSHQELHSILRKSFGKN